MSTVDEPSTTSPLLRARSEDDLPDERAAKRQKIRQEDDGQAPEAFEAPDPTKYLEPSPDEEMTDALATVKEPYNLENVLPQSRTLMRLPPAPEVPPDGFMHRTCEIDVGISQYIGQGLSAINGIIKQRFTDFLVYETDMTHNVAHLNSIERPSITLETAPEPSAETVEDAEEMEPWPTSFVEALSPLMRQEIIEQLKELFLSGPEPPAAEPLIQAPEPTPTAAESGSTPLPGSFTSTKEKRKSNGKERGGKGRNNKQKAVDNRKVLSDPIPLKEARSKFHQVIRDLFKGRLETFTEDAKPGEEGGSRIAIKWASAGGKGSRRSALDRDHQPYIHFTLQKTNRDTSDVLAHLSRLLKTDNKNLTVAGTKDKRGVTTQRICLRRCRMSVEEVWDKVNVSARKSHEDILSERGERGVRIGDLSYRKGHLQLGMLKGNEFLITLRNVKAPSIEAINASMEVLKTKGFINYYGMQRFGTASIPTHAIGLALLQSDWNKAVDLIMRPRPGESPDVEQARRAWEDHRDVETALALLPRRVVAERCLLESFQKMKGDTRNLVGALATIPRNLRTMYVHAYQSYVWNAIVSERIRRYGYEKPIVGDVVYDEAKASDDEEDESNLIGRYDKWNNKKRPKKKVKVLQDSDVDNYTIYDVLMPLPGTDVAYPGGELGELYKEFLKLDGLDPSDFSRKQREYSLAGSYRKILHLPKEVSWEVMRYTNPDIPLAQSDEDKILGIEPPQVDPNGKFLALQIKLQLGTASYATMAIREVTKVDTSSHIQTSLTEASEDQLYKGAGNTIEEGEKPLDGLEDE